MAAVGRGCVGPERRHLDLPGPLRPKHRDHAERRPHGERPAASEQVPDLLRTGGRRDVVIGRCPPQEVIPYAPPGPVGLVTGPPEAVDDRDGEVTGPGGVGKSGGHDGGEQLTGSPADRYYSIRRGDVDRGIFSSFRFPGTSPLDLFIFHFFIS